MMEWTDRHCRSFHRVLTQRALVYTEMVTSKAIIHGDRDRLLGYGAHEHPIALQVGGSDPDELAQCAQIAHEFGYDEINLNCGCPSDRVQSGRFGACLMAEPQLVADCMAAMAEASPVKATVKCRLGIDDQNEETALYALIEAVSKVGISDFIIHARKAWLKGLSPKENRDVPPLNYDLVYQIKRDFPHLTLSINGGITSLDEAKTHLEHVDGVMMGRSAYHEPALLGQVDGLIFGEGEAINPFAALEAYRPYMQTQLDQSVPLSHMARHMLGLMHGLPGARAYRRILTVDSLAKGAGLDVLDKAIEAVQSAQLDVATRRDAYISASL